MIAEPQLHADAGAPDTPWQLARFAELFNRGEYFEAHEILEDHWVTEVPPLKEFYKGLIMAAVALCHRDRGRHAVAKAMWRDARRKLLRYPERCEGVALAPLIESIDALLADR